MYKHNKHSIIICYCINIMKRSTVVRCKSDQLKLWAMAKFGVMTKGVCL